MISMHVPDLLFNFRSIVMTENTQSNQKNWQQANKWEFYKNAEGLWSWRAIVPEGWDWKKGEWSQNAAEQAKKVEKSNWEREGINWVEIARSQEWYASKSDCEASARKHGWK